MIVVDMQNAFASKGGMLDIAGADISSAALVTQKIATSEELSAMVKSGELKIAGGIYDLDTGKIEMMK